VIPLDAFASFPGGTPDRNGRLDADRIRSLTIGFAATRPPWRGGAVRDRVGGIIVPASR